MKIGYQGLFTRFSKLIPLTVIIALMLGGCNSSQPASGDKQPFIVTSAAFQDGEQIPGIYTESNFSIPISWEHAPKETKSYALFMVDLHPVANMWVHWVVVNIPANTSSIPEGASLTDKLPAGSKELLNSSGQTGYFRPAPPAGSGNHEYKIHVYALNEETIDIPLFVSYEQFQEHIKDHVIDSAEISGFFEN